MPTIDVPKRAAARRFYTRSVPTLWWVAGPVVGLVIFCASLGAITAWYYGIGVATRAPERFYEGSPADVTVPIWATTVYLWAEFETTPAEASDLVDLYTFMGLHDYFTGTVADGSPWLVERSSDVRWYLREDAGRTLVGVPIGSSYQVGDVAAMTEITPSGYALGFVDGSTFDALPLSLVVPALIGMALFLGTFLPRRNTFETALESELADRRAREARQRSARARESDRRSLASARADYRRQLGDWSRKHQYFLRRDPLYDARDRPVDPDAASGTGPIVVLMTLLVLAGPLSGLAIGLTAGVQTLGANIAGNSVLTTLLPIAGDTPWRVFVMTTTALLVVGLPTALGAILAWRVHLPRVRWVATIATAVLIVLMLVFVIIGTTLPIERAIR